MPHDAEKRFVFGRELGRGGLGLVVEALEADLNRTVAVKLVREDLPPELAERFAREAQLTARLEHPNIVPIHEFATIDGEEGAKRLMLCMKRVQGRDLGKLLKEVMRGNEPGWTRYRLLGVFQQICQGMAFAHAQGVIHRDLKPANVMIGEFGEVLIVDWGLAKELGVGRRESGAKGVTVGDASDDVVVGEVATVVPRRSGAAADVTLEGDLIGTPAYMPPEQAAGRLAELDERSDIYSLGAILYEILTQRPPVEGDSIDELLANARSGKIALPSSRKSAAEPVPPDLDAICMKALAVRKEDRYARAAELHYEIQLFLEGVKERERKQREAREHVAAGKRWSARVAELGKEIEAADRAVNELREQIRPHLPVAQKRPLWEAERRLSGLSESRLQAISEAGAAFAKAVAEDPASGDAADAQCAFDTERFLEAEGKRDREQMILGRNALARHDRDGKWMSRLDAPGTLSIRAFAFECDCLRPSALGVEIAPECTIPWRDGRARPDLPLEDKDRPVPAVVLKGRFGHTAACPRRELRGVRVRIARYEEKEKRLVLGDLRDLGTTPLGPVELPQGSWRCTLEAEGFAPLLLPVRIDRGAAWNQDVTLYAPADIAPGFLLVPGGPYPFGGLGGEGSPTETLSTLDVFISRLPVTFADYMEFLNAIPVEEARRRVPRDVDRKFATEAEGRFSATVDVLLPLYGASWLDALAYAAWRSARDGRFYRLAHEEEFEKAARGVDGRLWPWGNEFDSTFCNGRGSHEEGPRLLRPGAFEADESPYGHIDLGGNLPSWCWNAIEEPLRYWMSLRGAAFDHSRTESRSAERRGFPPVTATLTCGVRLCYASDRY
ncbi:MAG: protein kinase [Planctomycetes bacterium]|nr:protein kinase [Planctomycetota bacterium]